MDRLTARQRRLLRGAMRAAPADPSERGGELNIVPFLDIVVNLMLFMLATATVALAVAQTEAELPAHCRGAHCPRVAPGLDLSVTLVEDGIVMAGRGGRLAPGCAQTTSAPVPSVPRAASGYDFGALRACAERVHAAYPDEDSVTLGADPGVPYSDVIAAMDALRGTPEAPLFVRVRLSAGVR